MPHLRLDSDRSAGTPRVLFACGGTGGHVYPAIAIADAVRALAPDAAIAFAGTRDRMEWEAVPKAGYPIHAVTAVGFQRGALAEALARNLPSRSSSRKASGRAGRSSARFDPDVVVGTGGYVSGPVGLAASLRGVPLALQEQNAYAGATNKLLAKRADARLRRLRGGARLLPRRQDACSPATPSATTSRGPTATRPAPTSRSRTAQRVLLAMGGSLGAGPDQRRPQAPPRRAPRRRIADRRSGRRAAATTTRSNARRPGAPAPPPAPVPRPDGPRLRRRRPRALPRRRHHVLASSP